MTLAGYQIEYGARTTGPHQPRAQGVPPVPYPPIDCPAHRPVLLSATKQVETALCHAIEGVLR